jgi:hypothetical protein
MQGVDDQHTQGALVMSINEENTFNLPIAAEGIRCTFEICVDSKCVWQQQQQANG